MATAKTTWPSNEHGVFNMVLTTNQLTFIRAIPLRIFGDFMWFNCLLISWAEIVSMGDSDFWTATSQMGRTATGVAQLYVNDLFAANKWDPRRVDFREKTQRSKWMMPGIPLVSETPILARGSFSYDSFLIFSIWCVNGGDEHQCVTITT